MLDITISDIHIETVKFNYSTQNKQRKDLKFWLITLQHVDRNSWEKINSGILKLKSTGEFLISTESANAKLKGKEALFYLFY